MTVEPKRLNNRNFGMSSCPPSDFHVPYVAVFQFVLLRLSCMPKLFNVF